MPPVPASRTMPPAPAESVALLPAMALAVVAPLVSSSALAESGPRMVRVPPCESESHP